MEIFSLLLIKARQSGNYRYCWKSNNFRESNQERKQRTEAKHVRVIKLQGAIEKSAIWQYWKNGN